MALKICLITFFDRCFGKVTSLIDNSVVTKKNKLFSLISRCLLSNLFFAILHLLLSILIVNLAHY